MKGCAFLLAIEIVHVTTVHPPTEPRILYRECWTLSHNPNYRVMLAAPNATMVIPGVEGISLPLPSSNRIFRVLQSNTSLIKLLNKFDAKIWHIHDPELLLTAIPYAFFSKRKFIWDAHEDYLLQFRSKRGKRSYYPGFLRIFLYLVLKLVLKLASVSMSGVVVATESISYSYKNSRISVIRNLPNLEPYYSLRPEFGKNTFLFLGALDSSSMFNTVVQAGASIQNFKLIVAGNCNLNTKQAVIEKLGSRVDFLGYLNLEQMTNAILSASYGFVTYEKREQEIDAFPTKLGELLASGLPIVSSPNSFLSTLNLSNFGVVSNDFSEHSIKEAIQIALKVDRETWTRFSNMGKNWSIANSWQKCCHQQLLDFYSDLS